MTDDKPLILRSESGALTLVLHGDALDTLIRLAEAAGMDISLDLKDMKKEGVSENPKKSKS